VVESGRQEYPKKVHGAAVDRRTACWLPELNPRISVNSDLQPLI
jgi:hypothetical protein